jgi:PAS domain S-box-containing protein
VGLPWRVWIGTRPVWIENLASSPDHQASTGAAFTNGSGFAVPIASPQHTIGAIQFLSKARRPTDPHILELAEILALQLAQFIEWHRARESLQRSEAKFRALLEFAPDALIITAQTGHIVLVNSLAERLFGYSRNELLGQSVELLIPLNFRPTHEKSRAEYCASPRPRPMGLNQNLRALCKNGTEVPVEISLSPIQLGDEFLVMAAVRDVTERKRAQALEREHAELLGALRTRQQQDQSTDKT